MINIMKTLLLLAGLFLAATPSTGQDTKRTTQHNLASEYFSGERTFTVQVPESYVAYGSYRFPVLYLLDGDGNLAHAGPVVDYLAESGKIPEMIVVAIHTGATRSQDFIPDVSGQDEGSTGAAQFLSHLEDELIPFVETQYRTAPLRVISGHSLGGLFVTWAMVSGSGLADAYLAQSPYLAQNVGDDVVDQVGTHAIEPDMYYHANLGDEPDLAGPFDQMEDHLESLGQDAFRWNLEREPEEDHMSTRLIGLYNGLTGYFRATWGIGSDDLETGGVQGLADHVQGLTDRYGYPVLFSEQPFQELTQRFLAQRDVVSAREAAQLYVHHHDPSVLAHFMLGVAQISSGHRAEGLSEIKRAMALHEANPDPALAPVYGQMQQLRQQLEN